MKAVIFAAGEGTRLGSLTKETPKPLVKVGDQTCIEHIIDYLNSNGINQIVINTHHLADQFPQALGQKAIYSYEPILLGTAGTLHYLQDWMSEDYIVMNGDTISTFNLEEILDYHVKESVPFTAVVNKITGHNAGLFIVNRERTRNWWRPFANLDDILEDKEYSKFMTDKQYFDIGTPSKLQLARNFYDKR